MNNGKAKLIDSVSRLEISLPSKKNLFVLVFATAWLGGWYFGFKNALRTFSYDKGGNLAID